MSMAAGFFTKFLTHFTCHHDRIGDKYHNESTQMVMVGICGDVSAQTQCRMTCTRVAKGSYQSRTSNVTISGESLY